jgi:hypothetical protein
VLGNIKELGPKRIVKKILKNGLSITKKEKKKIKMEVLIGVGYLRRDVK